MAERGNEGIFSKFNPVAAFNGKKRRHRKMAAF
jgi:hypothetical protein